MQALRTYKVALFLISIMMLFALLAPSERWQPPVFSKDKKRLFVGVGLLFLWDNKILLLYRDKTRMNRGTYDLVDGLVNKYESVEHAAIRIANDELGVGIAEENLQLAHCMLTRQEEGVEVVSYYFVVKKWNGEVCNKRPEKYRYVGWFSPCQLPWELIERNRIAIEAIENGIPYSEYGYEVGMVDGSSIAYSS